MSGFQSDGIGGSSTATEKAKAQARTTPKTSKFPQPAVTPGPASSLSYSIFLPFHPIYSGHQPTCSLSHKNIFLRFHPILARHQQSRHPLAYAMIAHHPGSDRRKVTQEILCFPSTSLPRCWAYVLLREGFGCPFPSSLVSQLFFWWPRPYRSALLDSVSLPRTAQQVEEARRRRSQSQAKHSVQFRSSSIAGNDGAEGAEASRAGCREKIGSSSEKKECRVTSLDHRPLRRAVLCEQKRIF